jgi:hypothetical protein
MSYTARNHHRKKWMRVYEVNPLRLADAIDLLNALEELPSAAATHWNIKGAACESGLSYLTGRRRSD